MRNIVGAFYLCDWREGLTLTELQRLLRLFKRSQETFYPVTLEDNELFEADIIAVGYIQSDLKPQVAFMLYEMIAEIANGIKPYEPFIEIEFEGDLYEVPILLRGQNYNPKQIAIMFRGVRYESITKLLKQHGVQYTQFNSLRRSLDLTTEEALERIIPNQEKKDDES